MKISRAGISSRALHWAHAVIFIWLLVTGIQLFLTPKSLLGNPLIIIAHVYASIPFAAIPLLIYISNSSARNDVNELMSGKSNAAQKANFMLSLLLIIGLLFSGFVVWQKPLFTVNFVEMNFLVHDFLTIIAILLLSGHIVLAIKNLQNR